MLHEQRHIVFAIAQRRELDVNHMQAVVQIFAEASFFHQLAQIHVGGGDDAHIHFDHVHPAEAHELAFLHHAQQLGLRLEGNVADFVEEDAPFVGQVEEAFLRVHRAGECAFYVPEQRGFEKIRRQVAGVHGHERAIFALRVRVNGACHQLFARAALTLDENRRAARRRLDDEIEHAPHGAAPTDDVVEVVVLLLQILSQRAVLGHQAAALERVAQNHQHFIVLEGLGDVVEGAPLHCGNRVFD